MEMRNSRGRRNPSISSTSFSRRIVTSDIRVRISREKAKVFRTLADLAGKENISGTKSSKPSSSAF